MVGVSEAAAESILDVDAAAIIEEAAEIIELGAAVIDADAEAMAVSEAEKTAAVIDAEAEAKAMSRSESNAKSPGSTSSGFSRA